MRKKILSAVLVVFLMATTLYCFIACNRVEMEGNLAKGSYPDSLEKLLGSSDAEKINAALSDTATEDEKKDAVMALYNVANQSRMNTSLSLMLQESDAGIDMGSVIMHAFNLRYGDKWFYQLATQVETGNAFLNEIMSAFAGYLKVGYATGDGNFYYFGQLGPQFKCDCSVETFPYATYVIPADENDENKPFSKPMNEQELKQELHYLNSMHEINNMKFTKEIIADGAVISYNSQEKFYRVEFSVDMQADAQLLEEWFALPKEDMAVGGQTLERYNSYTAVLEVWDNGYAKSFESHADREAGMGSGKPVDRFEYLWNKREIMEVLQQDERIEEIDKLALLTVEDYIDYYSDPLFVKKQLGGLEIFGIVVGCLVFVAIVVVVTVEVLVRAGKLPKLAARRAARKAKRARKKSDKAKNGLTQTNIDASANETDSQNIETDDEPQKDVANEETD